jgi:hypothetical protein
MTEEVDRSNGKLDAKDVRCFKEGRDSGDSRNGFELDPKPFL